MASHYFRVRRRGGLRLVSDFLRGVTVEFYTAAGVFSHRGIDEGTRLLIEHAKVPEEGVILDLGCGYGAIGITLAKAYPRLRVVMVDIDRVAVELAKRNAAHNNVDDRVIVLQGDLYEPVRNQEFDSILSNPPITAGMRIVERIIAEAPDHLKSNGSLQLVVRKGAETVKNLVRSTFGEYEILARKRGYIVIAAYKT